MDEALSDQDRYRAMTPREAGAKGGAVTLQRYGREHFARITDGHPRRPRHKERVGRPAVAGTTTSAKEVTGKVVPFRGRASSHAVARSVPGQIIQFRRD